MVRPLLGLLAALCLAACLAACLAPEESPPAAGGDAGDLNPYGRELGTLLAIYPQPRPDGGYDLELQLTRDTILAGFETIRDYAADSVGRAIFRSTQETFYTRDGLCFFTPRKAACLPYRKPVR